jgi:hypothetical protein
VANGEDWFHVGEPVAVIVELTVDESANTAPDTVFSKSFVLVTAVNGAVGTVKVVTDGS